MEAASYLSTWKNHRDAWKFNKNTQSWLIRHMYESDKVSKTTFAVLLDYLRSSAATTRQRIVTDAKRRALRYKEYEKTKQESNGDDDKPTDSNDKEPPAAEQDDETVWNKLNDHDKRKVYKRTRKILETLKE